MPVNPRKQPCPPHPMGAEGKTISVDLITAYSNTMSQVMKLRQAIVR